MTAPRRRTPTLLLLLLAASAAPGCDGHSNAESTPVAAPPPAARTVHTRRLVAQDRVETLRQIGNVNPLYDVTLSAEVSGHIAERLAEVGDTVAAGDVLVRIDDQRLRLAVESAEAELERLAASLDQRRRDLKRAENLHDDRISSADALESARTAVRIAEAARRGQQAGLDRLRRDLSDTVVRSPVSGHIVQRMVDVGELVSPGTPLYRIVDSSTIKIVTRVNEVDIAKVRIGTEATIAVDAYPDEPIHGTVTSIAVEADPATRTFPISITLANRERNPFLIGMVARIDLAAGRLENVVTMRQDAIVERGGRRLAYVIRPDGTVQERELALGKRFGTEAVIASGLAAGEEVVVRGQFSLADGDAVHVTETEP